jgi:hypothetical protein
MNTELKVGMLAMIINVERPQNADKIGIVVTILDLMDLQQSKEYFLLYRDKEVTHPYAIVEGAGNGTSIRQDYLIPLPPLGDVYDQEMMDEMENTKIYTHN